MIDPTFNNVNRLFVLAFKNEEDRLSFSEYYTPTVEIKDYNVLIDQKTFLEIPIRDKEETYQAITELIRSRGYFKGNLLDYDYVNIYYKLIAIYLSKHDNDLSKQQINFTGKLERIQQYFLLLKKKNKQF